MDVPGFDGTCVVYVPYGHELPRTLSKPADNLRSPSGAGNASITVYGYTPAWGLPDISPHVTKLVTYMTFAGLDYTWKPQDMARLDKDSPFGKVPYILDENGTKVGDSNRIITYLKQKYGDPLDNRAA